MHDLTPDDLPDDATRAATDEDRVEADLSELSGPARAMLDALLTSAGIDHLWQGALLVAPGGSAMQAGHSSS